MKVYVVLLGGQIEEIEIKNAEELREMSISELFQYSRNLPHISGGASFSNPTNEGSSVDIRLEFFTTKSAAEHCTEVAVDSEDIVTYNFRAWRRNKSLTPTELVVPEIDTKETYVQVYFEIGFYGKKEVVVDKTFEGFII